MGPLTSPLLPEALSGRPPLPLADASALLHDLLVMFVVGGPTLMLAGAAHLITTVAAAQIPCTCGRCP